MTTQLPNEEQIAEIFLTKLSEGANVQDLDAASILGVTNAQIKAAQKTGVAFKPPVMTPTFTKSRLTLGEKIIKAADNAFVSHGLSVAARQSVSDWAREGGVWTILEWTVGAGVPLVTREVPKGFLNIQLVAGDCLIAAENAGVKIENTDTVVDNVSLAPDGYRAWLTKHKGWKAVKLAGIGDVAATNGDGQTLVVFANILGRADRAGWTANPAATKVEADLKLLSEIVTAAKADLKKVVFNTEAADAEYQKTLKNLAGYVDTLKAMVRSEMAKLDTESQRYEIDIRQKQGQVNQYSMQLAQSINEVSRYEAALETLPKPEAVPGMLGPIQTLIAARNEIAALDFVDRVEVVPDHGTHTIKVNVTLYPAHVKMGDAMRRVDALTFTFFTQYDKLNVTLSKGAHPHVDNKVINWGNVAMPIAEAMGRNNWPAAMRLISRWVQTYDADTASLAATKFAAVDENTKGFAAPKPKKKVAALTN